MKKMNQKGFGLIEGLLIIIALSLVVFVGYYVWHTQQENDKAPASSSQKASTDEDSAIETKSDEYLSITELGIKIPVSSTLKGLKYEVAPDESTIGFSTTAFEGAVGDCADQNSASSSYKPIVSINKVVGIYSENDTPVDVYTTFAKQFSGFYITSGSPDGGFCTGSDTDKNDTTKALYEKLAPAIKKAVTNAQQL